MKTSIEKLEELAAVSKIYLVGGGVRDALNIIKNRHSEAKAHLASLSALLRNVSREEFRTEINSPDLDVCGALSPEQMTERLPKGFTSRPVNARLGTLLILSGQAKIEYTPFRLEIYPDGGAHSPAEVAFPVTLEEDAARRDFTVNAIYYDLQQGVLIDPLGGIADLSAERLNLCAEDTLRHDGLRLLRLVRFEATCGFSASKQTARRAKKERRLLCDIAPERVRAELIKTFVSREAAEIAAKKLKIYGLTRVLGGRDGRINLDANNLFLSYILTASGKDGRFLNALFERVTVTKTEQILLRNALSVKRRCTVLEVADTWADREALSDLLDGKTSDAYRALVSVIETNNLSTSVAKLAYRGERFIEDYPNLPKNEVGAQLKILRDAALISGTPNEFDALKKLYGELTTKKGKRH